jgi:hypothetical protein
LVVDHCRGLENGQVKQTGTGTVIRDAPDIRPEQESGQMPDLIAGYFEF